MESGETILPQQASYPDRMGVSQGNIQACDEYGRILSDEAAHTEEHSLLWEYALARSIGLKPTT